MVHVRSGKILSFRKKILETAKVEIIDSKLSRFKNWIEVKFGTRDLIFFIKIA